MAAGVTRTFNMTQHRDKYIRPQTNTTTNVSNKLYAAEARTTNVSNKLYAAEARTTNVSNKLDAAEARTINGSNTAISISQTQLHLNVSNNLNIAGG